MSTPIIENIANNLLDTINAVTTGNGFNQTITAQRPRRIDFEQTPWSDLDCIISQIRNDSAESDDPISYSLDTQQFLIEVFAVDSDTSTTALDTRLNKIAADIKKKLLEDITRGGYARDTTFNGFAPFESFDGSPGGVAMTITVEYLTDWDDPYSVT